MSGQAYHHYRVVTSYMELTLCVCVVCGMCDVGVYVCVVGCGVGMEI